MKRTTPFKLCVLLIALPLASGCGDPNMGRVGGTLSFSGQHAPKGLSIEFKPLGVGMSSSYGMTDDNGSYEMYFSSQQKGVMVGPCKVVITKSREEDFSTGEIRIPKQLEELRIPEDFSSQSTFEVEVGPGSQTIDIDIPAT